MRNGSKNVGETPRHRDSRTRWWKKPLGTFLSLAVLYSVFMTAIPAQAAGEAVSTDETAYQIGDTVLLSGSGWIADSNVEVVVDDDSGDPWSETVSPLTDATGSFADFPVILPASVYGGFTVDAGAGTATATFTVDAPPEPPAPPATAPTLDTDADTYAQGDTVQISGADWGE